MAKNIWRCGFSLIEIIVVVGILMALFQCVFLIGVPDYERYVSNAQKNSAIDTLLEARARAMATGQDGVFSAQGLFLGDSTNDQKINIDQYGFFNGR